MAERYFYGFEPGEADRQLRNIVSGPDASVPAIYKWKTLLLCRASITALYDTRGRRIDGSAARTISQDAHLSRRQNMLKGVPEFVSLPSHLEVVHKTVLLGGQLMTHYGHFLIEGMSRLWARDLFPTLPILFTSRTLHEPVSYAKEVFNALGLRHRILLVEEPTIFREVVCPGTAFEYRWKAFSVADEPHTAAAKALNQTNQRSWRRPVYLTRSGLSDHSRKSEAEPELEYELSRRGFEVIRPETLQLTEQISLFEKCPLVVGILGSALHTALFSHSSETRLAVLNWGRGFEHYLLVDAVKQHSSYYVKSSQRDGMEQPILDTVLTLELLEEAGLLAPQTRVGFRG